MRLPGYCTKCRRIRQINVRFPMTGGVQSGICADCEDKERKRDEERRRRG